MWNKAIAVLVAKVRWLVLMTLGLGLLVVLAGGVYYVCLHWNGNLHVVTDGLAYRSGQLNSAQLEALTHRAGLKAVINLRGNNAGKDWYDDEKKTTQQLGLIHYEFRLSASRELSVEEMHAIVQVLDTCPKPVLIHCGSGTDRTGLVAALYRLRQGGTFEVAQSQLSLAYGHFPFFGNTTVAMDHSLRKYFDDTNLGK